MTELSIVAAAREAGDRVALIDGARRYTFADLARLARECIDTLAGDVRARIPHPVIGSNTLPTLITLYALLELRVPALLLHPRLTEGERAHLLGIAERVGAIAGDDAAVVLFTSGTTGEPRGVVLTRAALVASANASAANIGWHDDDCWLACMTVAHVGGLSIVTRCLAARRTLALAERFEATSFVPWIDAARVTLASVVPTMLARVLDAHPRWTPPAHVRALLVGGAAPSPRLVAQAAARKLPIVMTYGSTETCSQIVATPYDERYAYAAADGRAGRPLPGAEVRIVDGRIHARGAMLMSGYWDEAARAPDAWFDTGDAGAIDARGYVHVLGRRTDLIVTGGENVYPAEVERVLESLPCVAAAAVFGVADEVWGETVAAALVVDGSIDFDAMAARLRVLLAPHKRPRSVCVVGELPHTRGGKLDRAALPALAPGLRPLRAPGGGAS